MWRLRSRQGPGGGPPTSISSLFPQGRVLTLRAEPFDFAQDRPQDEATGLALRRRQVGLRGYPSGSPGFATRAHVAERAGFEPARLIAYTISNRAHSTGLCDLSGYQKHYTIDG